MESLAMDKIAHQFPDRFHSPAALRFGCKVNRGFWDVSPLPTIKSDIIDFHGYHYRASFRHCCETLVTKQHTKGIMSYLNQSFSN